VKLLWSLTQQERRVWHFVGGVVASSAVMSCELHEADVSLALGCLVGVYPLAPYRLDLLGCPRGWACSLALQEALRRCCKGSGAQLDGPPPEGPGDMGG
jgi:hypothetical protein